MKRDCIIQRIEVWWVLWRHYGLSFSNVCMRPEFMMSMSCDSVYCMCGAAWSSRWLMTQLTNGERACMLVFVPMADILNILCNYQFVFSVLDELCFTPCLMQRVIFKECIVKVWNVMFSFSLGSISTLFRWGGHFCRVCMRYFFLLTTVQKLQKSIKIFQSYDHKRTAPFYGSQRIRLNWTTDTGNPCNTEWSVLNKANQIHANTEIFHVICTTSTSTK